MRAPLCLWMISLSLVAAPPATTGSGEGSDRKVALQATVYLDPAKVAELIGQDPGRNILVVSVKLTPGKGEKVVVNLDDFLMRSDRTGEVVRPLEPPQIAGSSVMVVRPEGGQENAPRGQTRLPFPLPGRRRSGGNSGGSGGGPNQGPNSTARAQDQAAGPAVTDTGSDKPNPLLDELQRKILPEGETEEPVSGLLYFMMEGKLRVKDLELVYRKSPPRVSVRFLEPGKTQ